MILHLVLAWKSEFCYHDSPRSGQILTVAYISQCLTFSFRILNIIRFLFCCFVESVHFASCSLHTQTPPRPTAVPNMYGLWLSGLWRFSVCPTPHPLFLLLGWNSWNLCSLDTKALTPWSLWVLKTWVCFQLEGLRCRRLGLVIFNQLLSHGDSLR